MTPADDPRTPHAFPRRRLIQRAGGAAAALGLGACGDDAQAPAATTTPTAAAPPSGASAETVAFHGEHQAGILTAQQRHLRFVAFDVDAEDPGELTTLLQGWSAVAAALTAGRPAAGDTGEAGGLAPARLTVTFGFGPTLFERDGRARFGLAQQRPAALKALPPFPNDALEAHRSGGDVGVQICSDDAQVAYHAMHQLIRAAHGLAHPRWAQAGFTSAPGPGATPRNPLGFKDGTRNLDVTSARTVAADLWCADGPGWMRGGTYAVVRRVRTLLDTWDPLATGDQEQIIGRTKAEGAPLGGRREHDAPDLSAEGANGPVIPANAHIRLAAPERNGGRSLLRRSYNYDDGIDPQTGQLDTGLLFIAYQRDPARQFVPIQRRLALDDALSEHLLHTGSAVFACPPGATAGGTIARGLVA